jgi:molybdopterin/thiamine biosynthesis adenylyltransferase
MSTSSDSSHASLRVLVVGTGGVGAPTAIALAEAGVGALVLADEDSVEVENLHRQILFGEGDVGASKPEAAARSLRASLSVEIFRGRALPATARELVSGAHVVVDATDNFPTRFLLADACRLAGVPVVHAAAVRWIGTVVASAPSGRPCYRCLFEDVPASAPDCQTAGIIGPVCGVVGGIAAEMALSLARGEARLAGKIATFDGLRDELRLLDTPARASCALCGSEPSIHELIETRYTGAACAA